MGETGIVVRFPGSLDPRAEEFRPRNPLHGAQPQPQPAALFRPTHTHAHAHTQPCYPYPSPYAPAGAGGLVQPVPFCDASVAVGLPYPHFPAPAPYVGVGPPAVVAVAAAAPPVASLSGSPTRSLLLSSVPAELVISESSLRRELEVFGDVRGVQMEGLRDGMVTVHFYDLRHAETALTAIRGQHMQHQSRLRNHYASLFKSRNSLSQAEFYSSAAPLPPAAARGLIAGRAVWAQYVLPACNAVPDGQNQGTVVVFNLDSEVSAESVRQVFEAFGPVKELRDTPSKKNQRFVEFFDIRDAAKALKEMNGKEIHGKPVVIEFSRPGGHSRKFFHATGAASTFSKKPLTLNIPPPSPSPPPPFSPSPRKYSRRFAPDGSLRSYFKKSNKGSPNKIANSGSIETAVASMNLGEEVGNGNVNGVEEKLHSEGHPPARRNIIRKHSSENMVGSTKQQQQPARNRHWKGKQAKKHETRFLIKEDAIVESSSRDSRTTVMIKNIPNKYSQNLLLNMLDNHCIHCNEQIGDGDHQPLSSYDFVYLPIDFNNKCNVGYGFVNMTSPEATLRLYKAFHLQHWEVFNSRKICEVTYARVQGLEALKEHFKNSKFPCEMEPYLPAVFSPPRDGRQLSEPLPIVGHKQERETIPISIPNPIPNNSIVTTTATDDEMEGGGDRVVGGSVDVLSSSRSGGVDGDDDDDDDDDDDNTRGSGGEEGTRVE